MNNNSSNASAVITFSGLLTIAFIVLKLTGIIKWSWIWVLSPIWISMVIAILILAIFIFIHRRWR